MNYRHAFHAGNFADLLKHALLIEVVAALTRAGPPLTVIDTHAGAGIYDLGDVPATRTGEAAAGIERLLAESKPPEVFAGLVRAVKDVRRRGPRFYPGSPALIGAALRRNDSYIACELRPDDHTLLKQTLAKVGGAEAVRADGYETAVKRAPAAARTLVVIDPPFERADDYQRIVETSRAVLQRNRAAVIFVWLPIKDLDTLDRFETGLAAVGAPGFLAELRMRPLDDPLKMNGCAIAVLNPPAGLEVAALTAAQWLALNLGEKGALGRVNRL